MIYKKLFLYGTDVHVVVFNPSLASRIHVTNEGFKPVSRVAQEKGANLVINGDGWGLLGVLFGKPNSIAYSDGNPVQTTQKDYRPWVNFSVNNVPSFGWKRNTWWGNYNAVSGDRFLVSSGEFNTAISDRTTKDARTAIGKDPSNNVIVIVADGNSAIGRGLTFKELADLFIQYGADTAINLDGGGSTAIAINGIVVNVPNDDGRLGERNVINHLCVWSEEFDGAPSEPPPPVQEPFDWSDVKVTVTYDGETRSFRVSDV